MSPFTIFFYIFFIKKTPSSLNETSNAKGIKEQRKVICVTLFEQIIETTELSDDDKIV